MPINRRDFLKRLGAGALGTASLSSLGSALVGFNQAHAAAAGDYKALVCVFLFGGMDNHDTVIPYDPASYQRYAQIRASLLRNYPSRQRDQLLPLAPGNADDFAGRQFALPPQFTGLQQLFHAGHAALVGNVGPLVEPLTRSEWEAETRRLPKRLFSHNDQQATWMSGQPEGAAAAGWGGHFSDAMRAGSGNGLAQFSNIATAGDALFLTGRSTQPYQLAVGEPVQVNILEAFSEPDAGPLERQIGEALRAHFGGRSFSANHLIGRDIADAMQSAEASNRFFNQARSSASGLSTTFANGPLSAQLKAIAETIAVRQQLQVGRQVFLAGLGGFDTHSRQAVDLPGLQSELDGAISTFFNAMQEMGLSDQVTLFTASDFGRTLAINGDGTDHGWGAHHFVVGGAVDGAAIHGEVPPADFDHALDSGGGRLIPSVSVEQYAAPLGRWFGLSDAELAMALPNLASFAAQPLSFMRS